MARTRNIFLDIDWITILIYLSMVLFGLAVIYASLYDGSPMAPFDSSTSFGKQFTWFMISIGVAITLLAIDGKFYTSFAYLMYVFVLVLLILVLFFGIEVKGSKSWFSFGSFRFQPAELAKFATSLALSKFLIGLNVNLQSIRNKLKAAAIVLVPMVLIIIQGDTGSALVFTALILVLFREGLESGFLIVGSYLVAITVLSLIFNKIIVIIALALIAVATVYFLRKNKLGIKVIVVSLVVSAAYIFSIDYAFNEILQPHQRDRINVLVGKSGNDWNVRQSKIAIGSGGFWGKGYLNGTQTKFNFVPEQSTDFIFSTVGEELGFIGSFFLIALFVAFLLRLIFLAERQRSRFSRIYGYCVASIFFFHFAINIGMTIGLAPIIGIPLPFISYGGSSLLSFSILLFIFVKLDAQRLLVLR